MKKPTPETDAVAAYEGNWDTKALRMTAHSRKLERERDEAREKAERYRLEANAMMMQRDEWAAMCGRYKQERDEAREKYDQICSQTLIEINKVCDERDKLREALREVLKVSEPTPVMTYQKMEDIASKALKETK
jgi:uncharacterized coiled-coil DUF342 family protein